MIPYESIQLLQKRMNASISLPLFFTPADIEIVIPRNLCCTLEFTRAQEMIDYGYEKCKKVLG